MRDTIIIILTIGLLACGYSCKLANDTTTKVEDLDKVASPQTDKKTQALILTQPFDFDITDKNKMTSDYVTKEQLTIPQNLATQSKWIMFEGPVLENDLVAYRYYADSRHRFDIFGKTVSDLVMDTVSWKYHDIMDWGSDILKVGNSLGLGSPAIYYQDSLYTLSDCDQKTIEIIENGDNKSIIRTTFTQLNIEGQRFNLIQDWSIIAGQPWCEIHLRVIDGVLPEGMSFATGIVKHLPEIIVGNTDSCFYAMNWGKQTYHEEYMGMAILASNSYQPEHVADALSHAYRFAKADNEVKYKFLSVWEKDNNNVHDQTAFQLLVNNACRALNK